MATDFLTKAFQEAEFRTAWKFKQEAAHDTARDKGFWERERGDGELIALIHSELSEALEAAREGHRPDDKLPQYNGVAVELADAVIRIMDYAETLNVNLAEVIDAKMAYNEGREAKHGKAF